MSKLSGIQYNLAQNYRSTYIYLRQIREKLWLLPGIGPHIYPVPEINQLQAIIQNSHPDTLKTKDSGPRILFFSFRGGWSTNLTQDLVLAQALRSHGASPQFVTCAAQLPICDLANKKVAPPMPCTFCRSYIHKMVPQLRFPLTELGSLITLSERQQIQQSIQALSLDQFNTYQIENVPVGQLIDISVPRFLLRGQIDQSTFSLDIWRRFLISGAITTITLRRLLERMQPDAIWTMNGLFFSEKILHYLAAENHIPVINYEAGILPHTIVVARNQIANHYKLNNHWQAIKDQPLSSKQSEKLNAYLNKRRTGQEKTIASVYYPKLESSKKAIQEQLQLSSQKPLVLALTNILWDSAALYRNTIFNGIIDWLKTTISFFSQQSAYQLVIRIHPAEVGLKMMESEEPIADVIHAEFPHLPEHIKIVEADSDLSSYTLMEMAQYGLVYTSTTGLEMALTGKPVVVAGETHYANKGFTNDPTSTTEYLNWLTNPEQITTPTPTQLTLAMRYAYLFFFQMSYPYPYTTTLSQRRVQFNFMRLEDLASGANQSLDYLCHFILSGAEDGHILNPVAL